MQKVTFKESVLKMSSPNASRSLTLSGTAGVFSTAFELLKVLIKGVVAAKDRGKRK